MTRIDEPIAPDTDDSTLLQRFVATHDEAAFAVLVSRHGPMVLGICRRVLRDATDADDAFQATFLLLAMKAKRIRNPHLLGNWLFGVATRISIGFRRTNHRRVVQEKRFMRLFKPAQPDDTNAADIRMMLDEQISRLPEKLRRVIVCCHLEGLTKREAAARLKIPDSTITLRLKQARELLRQRLAGKAGEISEASLGLILVPMVVPLALSSATINAMTLAGSGKAIVAGAASGKAAGLSKGAASAILMAKLKLVATLAIAATIAAAGTATVARRETAAPVATIRSPTAPRTVTTNGTDNEKRMRVPQHLQAAANSIALYTKLNGTPADLKAIGYKGDDIEYLGQPGAALTKIPSPAEVAVVMEKVDPAFHGQMFLGFLDGHITAYHQPVARQMAEHSRQIIRAVAIGGPMPPAHPARPPKASPLQSVALPSAIRDALSHNATGLSPITVAWTRKAARVRNTQSHAAQSPKRVIWQNGKIYESADGMLSRQDAFDGTAFASLTAGRAGKLSKTPAAELGADNEKPLITAELLDQAGLHLPATAAEIQSGSVESEVLMKLDSGAVLTGIDSADIDGHPFTRLTIVADNPDWLILNTLPPYRTYAYFLDPAFNYAVRRTEERDEEALVRVTDNQDFEALAGRGIWLPRKSIVEGYRDQVIPDKYHAEPKMVQTFQVVEISLDPVSDTQFALHVGPVNLSHPLLPPRGIQLGSTDVLAHVASVDSTSAPQSAWQWIIAASAFVIALLLALVGIRRYRQIAR